MSLLDSTNEDVIVYPEEMVIDRDGNKMTRPSATGIPARARIWPQSQSGTSALRVEKNDGRGFHTEQYYSLRFARNFGHVLGAQSQIEWQGKRWSVFGDPVRYNGSARTRHFQYTIARG